MEFLLAGSELSMMVFVGVNLLRLAYKDRGSVPSWVSVLLAVLLGQLFAFLLLLRSGVDFTAVVAAEAVLKGFGATAMAMLGSETYKLARQ